MEVDAHIELESVVVVELATVAVVNARVLGTPVSSELVESMTEVAVQEKDMVGAKFPDD